MNPTQFYISVAVVPTTTLIIVLMGVLWSNMNMNARFAEMNSQINARFGDMNLRMNDLRDGLRAEIAKRHSELLGKFAELDARLTRIESHLEFR